MDNKPKSLISTLFKTREKAIEALPIYKAKGWFGEIIEIEPPKPLTKEERKNLETASRFLNKITGAMK